MNKLIIGVAREEFRARGRLAQEVDGETPASSGDRRCPYTILYHNMIYIYIYIHMYIYIYIYIHNVYIYIL